MKIVQRIVLIIFGILIIVIVAVNILFNTNFSNSKKKLESIKALYSAQSKLYKEDGSEMHYVELESTSENLTVFVHGSPGNWSDFEKYLQDGELQSLTTMISIDRPGYGGSKEGEPMHNIQRQVDLLKNVISQYDYERLFLIGHSYGGPVVGILAASKPKGLVSTLMLAPVNDPLNEKIFWFNPIISSPIITWMFTGALYSSIQEKKYHAESLLKVEDKWQNIDTKIYHMHCEDDWIAPYTVNIEFSKAKIPQDVLIMPKMKNSGHFIPWDDFESVKNLLISEILNYE